MSGSRFSTFGQKTDDSEDGFYDNRRQEADRRLAAKFRHNPHIVWIVTELLADQELLAILRDAILSGRMPNSLPKAVKVQGESM